MSEVVHDMFKSIASRYDLANDVLSGGVHRLWRKTAIRFAGLSECDTVLDLCCGTGDQSFALRQAGVRHVFGMDFVRDMLDIAHDKDLSMQPVSFINGDAMTLPFADKSVDGVSISFGIRNVDDPLECLRDIQRVLKQGGKLMVLEFGQSNLPVFSSVFNWYSRTLMPAIGGLVTGNRAAYEYLPQTSRDFPSGERFVKLLEMAGYESLRYRSLFGGIAYIYSGSCPELQPESFNEDQQAHRVNVAHA